MRLATSRAADAVAFAWPACSLATLIPKYAAANAVSDDNPADAMAAIVPALGSASRAASGPTTCSSAIAHHTTASRARATAHTTITAYPGLIHPEAVVGLAVSGSGGQARRTAPWPLTTLQRCQGKHVSHSVPIAGTFVAATGIMSP